MSSLQLPPAAAAVTVKVLSSNRVLNVPPAAFLTPEIPGTTYKDTPCLSFLIEHTDEHGATTRLLFDLGIRKDWGNLPPKVVEAVKNMSIEIETDLDVAEMLESSGVNLTSIDAVVFSHWHFDHIGDISKFPLSTRVVVGPGFKSNLLPGYPENPNALLDTDGFQGRQMIELDFSKADSTIAGMPALDWFSDGSFYILDTPGHAVGHISALARTTVGSSESAAADTFVFLAGDVCHHMGELRPHELSPLPHSAPTFEEQHDIYNSHAHYCSMHPQQNPALPFYSPSCGGFNLDAGEMQRTLRKVTALDADPRVFILLAHDHWVLSVLDHFPAPINRWRELDWAEKSRWRFLQDFVSA